MFMDFGVDPSSLDRMSLGEVFGMMDALRRRKENKDEMPDELAIEESMQSFYDVVRSDPSVKLE